MSIGIKRIYPDNPNWTLAERGGCNFCGKVPEKATAMFLLDHAPNGYHRNPNMTRICDECADGLRALLFEATTGRLNGLTQTFTATHEEGVQ